MAANVALARASVEGPTNAADVTVVVRGGVMRVTERRTGTLVASVDGVTAVERVDSRTWRVTAPGGVYTVVRARGCGCGR